MKILTLALTLLFSIACGAASLLDQVAAMQPGTWSQISASNSFLSVDPAKSPTTNSVYPNDPVYRGATGFMSVLIAWNSGGFVPQLGQCGTLVYHGGGHNNYFGNEIVGLDLCGGTGGAPIWKLLTKPYDPGPSGMQFPYSNCGMYPDGTPSPSEKYDTEVITSSSQMWIADTQILNTTAASSNCSFMYDFNLKQWLGPFVHRGAVEGAAAFDTKRNLIWFQPDAQYSQYGRGEFTSFDPVTKEFKYYGKVDLYPQPRLDQMMSYDPVNDLLVTTSFRPPGPYTVMERDPKNPTVYWKAAAQINPPPAYAGGGALAWSPTRGAFIVWMDAVKDGKVWELRRTGVLANVPQYTWTLLNNPANTVNPTAVYHNPGYDKFQLVQVSGAEILIGQMTGGDGVFAFRLPGGVVTPPPPPPPPPPGPSCIPQIYNTVPAITFCPVSAGP